MRYSPICFHKKLPDLVAGQFCVYCKVLLQLLNTDIAVLQALAVTQQTDVTCLVEKAGVVEFINGVGVLVATLGVYVATLAGGADVTINDNHTINGNLNTVALDVNLLGVPLAQCAPLDTLGGDNAID